MKKHTYIFFDTEFTDFTTLNLISVGCITEDGTKELYLENDDYNRNFCTPFVQTVVVPLLKGGKFKRQYGKLADEFVEWFNQFESVTLVLDYVGDAVLFDRLVKHSSVSITAVVDCMFPTHSLKQVANERGYMITAASERKMQKTYADTLQQQVDKSDDYHNSLRDAINMRIAWLAALNTAK